MRNEKNLGSLGMPHAKGENLNLRLCQHPSHVSEIQSSSLRREWDSILLPPKAFEGFKNSTGESFSSWYTSRLEECRIILVPCRQPWRALPLDHGSGRQHIQRAKARVEVALLFYLHTEPFTANFQPIFSQFSSNLSYSI